MYVKKKMLNLTSLLVNKQFRYSLLTPNIFLSALRMI